MDGMDEVVLGLRDPLGEVVRRQHGQRDAQVPFPFGLEVRQPMPRGPIWSGGVLGAVPSSTTSATPPS